MAKFPIQAGKTTLKVINLILIYLTCDVTQPMKTSGESWGDHSVVAFCDILSLQYVLWWVRFTLIKVSLFFWPLVV